MSQVARILGVSLLTGIAGAAFGVALFGQNGDGAFISLCVGIACGLIGAIAAAAAEIGAALREGRPALSGGSEAAERPSGE